MSQTNESRHGYPVGPDTAVMLAAGRGSRLEEASGGLPKPLIQVAGQTLAERAVLSLQVGGGIERVIVCVGYEAETVAAHFEDIGRRCGVAVECVNVSDWPLGNGTSALAAKERLGRETFLLSMTDHIFDPDIARTLVDYPLRPRELALAVDRNKDGIFDLDDVTRVRSENGEIQAIEKNLEDWDAADTGVMFCSSGLFDGLERAAAKGRRGLSDGLRELAERRRAKIVDVTGKYWIDVDTPEAHREAESQGIVRASFDMRPCSLTPLYEAADHPGVASGRLPNGNRHSLV